MRLSFGPEGAWIFQRQLSTLNGYYGRALMADNSPSRPGERIHCRLGELVPGQDLLLYWFTEVDPITSDLIGERFAAIPESIHIS